MDFGLNVISVASRIFLTHFSAVLLDWGSVLLYKILVQMGGVFELLKLFGATWKEELVHRLEMLGIFWCNRPLAKKKNGKTFWCSG